MLRLLYDKTLTLSKHKYADWVLAGVAFTESIFFPIPPDALLIPMVLAQRARAKILATICTLASVAGAALGYIIGYFLWDTIGQSIIAAYGGAAAFARFTSFYNEWGMQIVVAAAISILPFKVATIASGVTGLGFIPFLLACLVGRGVRFYLVAGLIYFFGPQIRRLIERYFGLAMLVLFGLLVLGFMIIGDLKI